MINGMASGMPESTLRMVLDLMMGVLSSEVSTGRPTGAPSSVAESRSRGTSGLDPSKVALSLPSALPLFDAALPKPYAPTAES